MKRFLIPFLLSGLFSLAKPLHAIENNIFKYQQMTSTTTVSTSAAMLHAITITDSVNVAFTVYDSTASDVTSPVLAVFEASAADGTYVFDVQAKNGIQINEAANGPQI